MENEDITNEEFIAEVQKYECIYDKNDESYSITSLRNRAWQQIAEYFQTSGKNHRTYTNALHISLQFMYYVLRRRMSKAVENLT